MKDLHFSGSGHSDYVMIRVHPDHRVEVICWNDGYPSPMSAGGYSEYLPEYMAQDYHQEEFIRWLKANFWRTASIDIYYPVEESVVKAFLKQALSE